MSKLFLYLAIMWVFVVLVAIVLGSKEFDFKFSLIMASIYNCAAVIIDTAEKNR
jgi:hypothetical protein